MSEGPKFIKLQHKLHAAIISSTFKKLQLCVFICPLLVTSHDKKAYATVATI